jgi:flagellar hook assembly protein FlgD
MAVDEARVAVEIHDLTGRRLVGVGGQILGQGLHDIEWDGTASGLLVPPGMYLARIVVDTDMGDGERVLTVPVVY